MDDLLNDFIAEAREGLEALDSELVRFEQQPQDPETLGGIFRLMHTIKGTSGFLGLMRLQTVAHSAENVLGAFRDGQLAVTPTAVTAVLDTVDLIRTLVEGLAIDGTEREGDDSALIARLEAVLDSAPATAEAAAVLEAEPASEPEPAPSAARERPLIDRLGGDATLDAVAEMAAARLVAHEAFSAADSFLLQAALRDRMIGAARQRETGAAFAEGLVALVGRPLDAAELGLALDCLEAEARALEVPSEVFAELRVRLDAAPAPAAVAEPPPDPMPEPVASEPVLPEPVLPVADPARSAAKAEAEVLPPTQTIRVSVDALEHLMTVVSELVLIRNQLIQALRLDPESPFAAPLNRLNQVTSELQEGVMTTRMQPISGAWAKLPRLVRDLAHELGKKVELVMFGQETELDRQVLELIKDPLTHMIRNAVDHGLETPSERRVAGKDESGRISLHARHEGGAIVIEVADDGRGLAADRIRAKALSQGLVTAAQAEQMSDAEVRQMIFMAGFSTASEITAVSGRGVGMDVVRTNIEKIGGAVELWSAEGAGTRFTIRIPLTLTIVSALIVECCGDRFAMPQSSVVELVNASGASGRAIEHIEGAAVLRLRDRLLPLIPLQALLGLEPLDEPSAETCIVVARVGSFTFGVIVDRVFDTEEIVVKPVASVLRHLKIYSGATILGDGSVILILDLKGVSMETGAGQSGHPAFQDEAASAAVAGAETTAMLVFRADGETLKAVPLASVARIEELAAGQIERAQGRSVVQYRGALMPILGADAAPVAAWSDDERRPLLVFGDGARAMGLLAQEIVDIVHTVAPAARGASADGILGSLIVDGAATEVIDTPFYLRRAFGEAEPAPAPVAAPPVDAPAAHAPEARKRLLLVDQSPFSQILLSPLLSQAGYEVVVAPDATAALGFYEAGDQFSLIMADTSNPALARGFALAFQQADRWHQTPLLSLSLQTGRPDSAGTALLDAVNEALGEERRVA